MIECLVDVFYYDFLLHKVLRLYANDAPNRALRPYIRMIAVLSKKFTREETRLDFQAVFKEVILRLYRVCRNRKAGTDIKYYKDAFKAFIRLGRYSNENTDPHIKVIRDIVFICYSSLYGPRKDDEFMRMIEQEAGAVDWEQLYLDSMLVSPFSSAIIKERLKAFKFDKPLLLNFVEQKAETIKRDRRSRKQRKVDAFGSSSGEKLDWE